MEPGHSGAMISVELARALRDAGLRWKPETGDRFVIDKPEVDQDVYTLAEMTVEKHDFPTGAVLGFNGTTEWALDSVAEDEALWIPREDQLRELLGRAFVGLTRVEGPAGAMHTVTARIEDADRTFAAADPAVAYGEALQAYIHASLTI